MGNSLSATRRPHTINLRDVERVVGCIACHDRSRKRQPERVKRRQTNLDLRQVRPVILAVSKLKQRVIAHSGVSLAGSRIHSHQLRLQVVDAQQFTIQFLLEWTPPFQVAKLIEKAGQSVVAEIERTDSIARRRYIPFPKLLKLKVNEFWRRTVVSYFPFDS